jgi:carbon storage regulator
MLVLTRRVGEAVMIGNDVVVAVVGVKGRRAVLACRPLKSVPVHREGVLERIQQEQRAGGRAPLAR